MPISEEFLLILLKACAATAPLYPKQYASEHQLDRRQVDAGLDELRRRGLVTLTEWMRELGQGVALTEAGAVAARTGVVPKALAAPPSTTDASEVYANQEDPAYTHARILAIREALLAPRRGVAARILLGLNIAYFVFGVFYAMYYGLSVEEYLEGRGAGATKVLAELGALHPYFVVHDPAPAPFRPEFERIVLFSFLHVGVLHLVMNLYFLGTLGRQIESLWGSWRFLVIYAISGIVSGCTILLIAILQTADHTQTGLTAGASGCLFGIFASMIVWFLLNYPYLPEALIADWSRSLGINVILLVAINFIPGISWQGHFGGAVGGLLAALLLHLQRFHPSRVVRLLALAGLPMVPLAFFFAVMWMTGWL